MLGKCNDGEVKGNEKESRDFIGLITFHWNLQEENALAASL